MCDGRIEPAAADGTVAMAGMYGTSDTGTEILLIGILVLLLAGGAGLLVAGIIDLLRDLRKSFRHHRPT